MISGIGDPGRLLIVGVALASCFAMVAAGVVVAASGEASEQGYLTLVCVPSAVFGGLVSIKQPRNPIGWILLAIAFFFPLQLVSGSYLEAHPDEAAATDVIVAAWFAAWAWIPAITLGGALLPLLFPNGRLFSPPWRYVAGVALAAAMLAFLSAILKPGPLDSDVPAINPIGIAGLGGFLDAVNAIGGICIVLSFIAAGYSQVVRFRKAEGEEREQLKWFAYIASVIGVGMFFAFLSTLVDTAATRTAGDIGWVVGALALGVGLPAAVGIAILRYRLYDIDWIISHTLVYVPLTALLAGVYIALTGVARALLSDNTGANSDAAVAFTTIVVVAMLTPAKNYLQEIVDRHFKEDRDPASRLDRLGKEARAVAEMVEPSLFVQRYLESTVDTLDSLGGSIKLNGQWKREFTYREIKIAALSLAISRDGQEIGVLQVSRRRSGRPYSPTEIEALRRSVDSVAYLVGLEDALRRGSVRSRV